MSLPASASAAACSFATPSPLPTADYIIETAADLEWLHAPGQALELGVGKTWTQTADIDMGGCTWSNGFGPLAGTYDGGGFEISGVDITTSSRTAAGLFEQLSGTIRNLGFTGDVTSTITSGLSFQVGALVGWLRGGTIANSYATGIVQSSYTDTNFSATGGLVGVARDGSTISGSHATGDVSAVGVAGGLVGKSDATTSPSLTILESWASGDVTATASLGSAGGLVGYLTNAIVRRSYASGDVSGVANTQHLGGLIAAMTNSTVEDSFATGGVSGWTRSDSAYGQVGGLVGDTTGGANSFTRTYAATISGMSPSSGSAFSNVGGVAGVVASTTWNRVAWNTETAPLVTNPIGSTSSVSGVTGYSTSQLTDISTFTDPTGLNWNSGGATTIAAGYQPTYTWGICATFNDGYPFLTAIYSSDPCTSPSPPTAATPASWPVFTFQTPGGGECTVISPQYPRLNSWFTLPDADAPCFIKGSVLTGWSIPDQDWAFAPGRRVWVVDSQVFTSVLEYEWVTIEYDSNVEAKDACMANGEDLPVADRTRVTHIPRTVITDQRLWDAPVCSAPAYEFLGWTTDNPHNDPTILPKDGTMPAPAVNSDGDAANVIHLYAMWKYKG